MKVIISDFDKTFFDNNFESNIELVNNFVNKGNLFVIATGRNLQSLMSEIKNKKIECQYYICNDGAIIYDKYLNPIYRKDIDKNLVWDIYNMINNDSNIIETLIDTTNGYTKNCNLCANKIIAQPYNVDKANKLLLTLISKYKSIDGYISTNWINITSKYVNKGNAIKFLMMYGNLKIDQIYTIGDDINDLSMMENFISFSINNNNKIQYNSKYTVNSFTEFLDIINKNTN